MSLFDDPLQLLIVGGLVVVLIMWGPKKIPELARALGQAKNEFAAGAAQKPAGLGSLASTFASVTSPSAAVAPAASVADANAALIETAERLGIPTEGKTAEQISNAIVSRAKEGN
jgi:sec-independent protein translocase protein TatA